MTRNRHDDGDGLYEDRRAKMAHLRSAVASVPGVTRCRRGDLKAMIELYEFKTLNDGRCRLKREEIGNLLHWGLWKVDEVRRLAEGLGWIEIDRESNRSGQGANKVRVAWERIKNVTSDINRSDFVEPKKTGRRLSDSETRIPDTGRRLSDSERPYKEDNHTKRANKETTMNHGGDGVSKKLYFGRNIERKDLRDIAFLVERVWPKLLRYRQVPDTDRNRLALVAFACEADRTFFDDPKIRDPVGLFVAGVNDCRFLGREIPDCDDEAARRLIRKLQTRPQPSILPARLKSDPEEDGRQRNYQAFLDRFGSMEAVGN